MSILERIPKYTLNNTNQLRVKAPDVYIDDIFDPLFNKQAKAYLDAKYGWGPLGNIFAGYTEGINNALIGQNDKWGILGPGMGILSGFGRSMDKADDFLIGGLTEGVNLVSKGLGNDVAVENPLENIFVNDEDYTGARLLAAMGNTMSNMAGVQLDETDFSGMWNIPTLGLELATDPGILGGSLAKRLSPDAGKTLKNMSSAEIVKNIGKSERSPLADVGQLLSNYDDLMAKVSWDLTVPGLRPALSKFHKHIGQAIASSKASRFQDVNLKNSDGNYFYNTDTPSGMAQWSTDPNIELYNKMLDDMYDKYAQSYMYDPGLMQEWAALKQAVKDEDFAYTLNRQNIDDFTSTLDKESVKHAENYKKEIDNMIKLTFDNYSKAFSDTVDETGKVISKAPVISKTSQMGDSESLFDAIARKFNNDEEDIKTEILYNLPDEVYNIIDDFGMSKYLNENASLDELKGTLDYLESGNFADTASDNAILQNALNKYKENSGTFTSSPVKIYTEPIYTQANPDLIKGLDKELKKGVLNAFELSDESIKNYDDLSQKIIDDLQAHGQYADLKPWIDPETSEVLRPATPPGMFNLFKDNKPVSYSKYLDDVKKFVNTIETIEKTSLQHLPMYKALIEMKDNIKSRYLNPMYFELDDVNLNPVTGLQSILNANPYAFYTATKTGAKEFDFDKFNHFSSKLPFLEVRVSDDFKFPIQQIYKGHEDAPIIVSKTLDTFFHPKGLGSDPELKKLIGEYKDYSRNYRLYTYVKNLAQTYYDELLETNKKLTSTQIKTKVSEMVNHHMFIEGIPGSKIRKFTDVLPPRITDEQKLFEFKNEEFKKYLTAQEVIKNNKNIEIENTYVRLNSKTPKNVFKNIDNFNNDYLISMQDDLRNSLFPHITESMKYYGLYDELSTDGFKNWIMAFSDKPARDLRWFDLVQAASISKRVNTSSDVTVKATLNTKRGQNLLKTAKELKTKYTPKQVSDYLTLKDTVNGDIVLPEDYLNNLKTSRGFSITILGKDSKKEIEAIENAIKHNNSLINTASKHGDLLELVKYNVNAKGAQDSKGIYTVIGYRLNPKNVKALKNVRTLKLDNSRLKPVVFQAAAPEKAAELAKYADLETFFKDSQSYSEDLSKTLGFTSFEENYFKHALSDNTAGGSFLKKVYAPLDTDSLDTLATLLGKNDSSLRGTFGKLPMTRTLRGGIDRYNNIAPIFSTDLEAITTSALAKGVFDDANFQSFVDLFVNDNFRISRWASNPEDLKRILYAKDDMGKLTGNLDNTQLIAPNFDSSGRLTGFTKFDKLSDEGLQKALQNERTVLLPTETVATLDYLTKKDRKLSNKVYNFINKTFLLPFKLGILANPGFLVGNLNDAYLKQATALASKHGTSVSEELTNVAISMRNVVTLNNQMSDIYTRYVEWCSLNKKYIPEHWKNYSILTSSQPAKNKFIDWLNEDSVLTGVSPNTRKKAQLWMYINNFQDTALYNKQVKKNYQEIEDIAETVSGTIYEADKNIVEKVFTGKGKYNPKDVTTWGLFTSNPLSNAVLKSSAQIETIMRSSAVLNDLTHKYSSKEIMDILEDSQALEKSFRDNIKNGIDREMRTVEALNRQQLEIDAMDALNVSSAANFNYEDTTGLIDNLSYVIPFPTFFLKNLAFWTNIVVENPQYIDNAISVQQGLWHGKDTSKDEFAAEAKGRGAVALQGTGQNSSNFVKGIFKPSPLSSMFGAFNLINNPVENLRYRVNPAMQLATSPLLPDEEVKYRPYNTNIYQKNISKDDKEFNSLAYMFHTLNPYERQVKTYLRTPNKINKGQAQLSDFLPSIFQPDFQ